MWGRGYIKGRRNKWFVLGPFEFRGGLFYCYRISQDFAGTFDVKWVKIVMKELSKHYIFRGNHWKVANNIYDVNQIN